MTTSPFQGNDYNAISFRPYELPINDIMKGLVAKNQYWYQGASKVKDRYNNVLGLDLLTNVNKQIVSDFTKKAQEEIQKLSSMDLSSADVQKKALAIFDPIFDSNNPISRNILYESGIVSSLNEEEAYAESSRNSNGGVNYNPIFHKNIVHQKAILSLLNRNDAWKAIGNQTEKYVPFTNMAKEIIDIKKAITERKNSKSDIQGDGWYIRTTTTEEISKEDLKAAIDEMGSPALKAQLRAEGRNTFYEKILSDPSNVDSYYRQLGSSFYDEVITNNKARIAEAEQQLYILPKEAPNYAEVKKTYDEAISTAKTNIEKLETQKNEFISSITGFGNLDNVASTLQKIDAINEQYSINRIAETYAYKNVEESLEANAAKIAMENINIARERINLQWAKMAQDEKSSKSAFEELFGSEEYRRNLPAEMKPGELEAIGKEALDNGFANLNNDAELMATFFSGVLKDNGSFYARIQEFAGKDVKLKDIPGMESTGSINELAEFVKNYAATKPVNYSVEYAGATIPLFNIPKGASTEQVKEILSNLTPSDFNRLMPKILSQNRNFVSAALNKFSGKQSAWKFRSSLDVADTNRANFEQTLLPEVKGKLGAYGKYMDGFGDKDIEKAYNRIPANEKTVYKKRTMYGTNNMYGTGSETIEVISQEEFNKNKGKVSGNPWPGASVSYFSEEMDFNDFKEIVTPIINKTIGEKVVNNYGVGKVYMSTTKDGQNRKDYAPVKEALQGSSNMRPELSELLNQIEQEGAFIGMKLQTPVAGQKTATATLLLDDKFAKELSSDQKEMLTNIPIASEKINQKWLQTSNPSDNRKFYGAVLANSVSEAKLGADKKPLFIKIVNTSNQADIMPKVLTNFPPIKVGNTNISVDQYLERYAMEKYRTSSFAELIKNDPIAAQQLVTAVIMEYENL